jgi:hypothetical protein
MVGINGWVGWPGDCHLLLLCGCILGCKMSMKKIALVLPFILFFHWPEIGGPSLKQ